MVVLLETDRAQLRAQFGLSVSDAVERTGVTVDEWERWEHHEPVPAHVHLRCEHLFSVSVLLRSERFMDAWRTHPVGCRAAAALAATYSRWIFETAGWVNHPDPLTSRTVGPMAQFNPVVFSHTVDVEQFTARVLRVLAVGYDRIANGQLPTEHCEPTLMVEAVLAAAVRETFRMPDVLRGGWFDEMYRIPDVGWRWDRAARQISGTYRLVDHRAFVEVGYRSSDAVLATVPCGAWFRPNPPVPVLVPQGVAR